MSFLRKKAISMLGGDHNKTASTALRVFAGRLVWGKTIPGYETEDGTLMELPEKVFYAHSDRVLVDNVGETNDDRIFINHVRKEMVKHEGELLKKFAIVILVAMLVMGAIAKLLNDAGTKHRQAGEMVRYEQEQKQEQRDAQQQMEKLYRSFR